MAEGLDERANAEGFSLGMSGTDTYGVPFNIMGRHPEEFFSLLGRIVSLAATLENKILSFYQYLVGRSQTEYSELSVSQHIAKSLKELQRLPARARVPGRPGRPHRLCRMAVAVIRRGRRRSPARQPLRAGLAYSHRERREHLI
jgi:hypothetical protein